MAKKEGVKMAGKPGYLWDTYETTPKMSTYLLAWVVFKMESAKSKSKRGVKFEAFYGNASLMQHAADVGAQMLDFFEQKIFVGINYNLPKMDFVAVPNLKCLAMENWGMVTFCPENVIYSEEKRDKDTIKNDEIIAHELVNSFASSLDSKLILIPMQAHQWTGNLVTCAW